MVDWLPAEREAWRPPEELKVSEWADRFRILDPFTSSEPGKWRTDRVPYAREWMDSTNCPWVHQVTIQASTQVGKTETLNNVLGFAIHQDPGPIMLVLPRKDDATTIGERRIKPMIRACPELQGELTSSSHDWKKGREVVFRRSILYFRSAQTPAELASVPVRYLFGDECDKWPPYSGKEAPPWALATERQRTFYNRIAYLTSTPTTRDGLINREFENGDKRRFHVPCPHCGEYQVLSWKRIKWPSDIRDPKEMRDRREAFYHCEQCNKPIEDRSKRDILNRGIWVPEEFTFEEWTSGAKDRDRAAHRSYHVWAGYSPWLSWWEIVEVFLKTREDRGSLQNFVNSWLGEVWEEKIDDPTPDALEKCQRTYKLGECPDEVLVVTAGVDVQKDRLPYVIRGWARDEVSFLLQVGEAKHFEELAAILFAMRWGKDQLGMRIAMVDSRYRRAEVMEFCREYQAVAKMVAGVERDSPIPYSTSKLDRHPRTGAPLSFSLTIWRLNVGFFKDLLSARIQATAESDKTPVGAFLIPEDAGERYIRQLTAEHKVRVRSGNKAVDRWILKPGRRRNDFLDAEIYALAAARLVRVDSLRSSSTQRAAREAERRQNEPQPTSRGAARPKLGGGRGLLKGGDKRRPKKPSDPLWGET